MRKDRFLQVSMIALFLMGGVILCWQLMHTTRTLGVLRGEMLDIGAERVRDVIQDHFAPVELSLSLQRDRGAFGVFEDMDTDGLCRMFIPVLRNNASVSSMLIADGDGREFMLLHRGGERFYSRTTLQGSAGLEHNLSDHVVLHDSLITHRTWKEPMEYDPRSRPWYQGALATPLGHVHWTRPYRFFTTREQGITASMRWVDADGRTHVVAYDVLLKDLAQNLHRNRPSPNGMAFLLADDDRVLSVSANAMEEGVPGLEEDELDPMSAGEVLEARRLWNQMERTDTGFGMVVDGRQWHASIVPEQVGQVPLFIGMLVPEHDVIARLRTSRRSMVAGAVALGAFAMLILFAWRTSREHRRALQLQNTSLKERTEALAQSLEYAKYLQDATLPTESMVKGNFPASYVLHLPKEKVGGDLYWMEPRKDMVLFAVADCTGHGVPGALVGMACTNALDSAVRELGYDRPADILETARQFVMEAFMHSPADVNDGMDICLCALHQLPEPGEDGAVAEVHFAGGNRPLWIVRRATGELEVRRTDRQPVGRHGRMEPFNQYVARLWKGDVLHLFTDGFTDQFGGPDGRKYGLPAMRALVQGMSTLPMEQQGEALRQTFLEWKGGNEQVDDLCMMGIRVH